MNYGYDDRYLFEFNIRHDGSSRMPKANRYATFPSVSGGWVFSNEELMKDYKTSPLESCVYHGVSWVTRKSVIMLMRLLWAQAEIISLTKVGTNRLVWYRLLFQMKTSNGKRPAPSMWPLILDSLIIGYRLL